MPTPNFSPFPLLKTKRLILRRLHQEDKTAIFAMHSDANNRQYIDKVPTKSILEAKQFIDKMNTGIDNNQWIYWAICKRDSLELVGTICLWNFSKLAQKADVGYELLPTFQGNGFMQEALQAVVEYGFQKQWLQSIEAYTQTNNQGSIRLLEKCNFVFKSKMEQHYYTRSGSYWQSVYEITN